MKKLFTSTIAILAGLIMISCCNKATTVTNCESAMKEPFKKTYTNADFYDADGNFKQDVAKKAYQEMLAYYDIPWTDLLNKDIWFVDFGMGDFENVGMGGIFWVNDAATGYLGHTIYLLPGQMIPEHRHEATANYAAKNESWYMEEGWAYNFSEIGDETANPPAIPEAQKASMKSKNFTIQKKGEYLPLKALLTSHFLRAGDEGAIVVEFGSYQDGAGLKFSNPAAAL